MESFYGPINFSVFVAARLGEHVKRNFLLPKIKENSRRGRGCAQVMTLMVIRILHSWYSLHAGEAASLLV
jgi:hypothetical protein